MSPRYIKISKAKSTYNKEEVLIFKWTFQVLSALTLLTAILRLLFWHKNIQTGNKTVKTDTTKKYVRQVIW